MMLAGAQIVDENSVAFTSGNMGTAGGSPPVPPAQGSSKEAQPVAQAAPAQGLHMIPKQEPVDIHFSNITCTVKLGITKGSKQILHGVHGRLRPRQLIAIMGPSGAGKSTLLDVLSGYRITGVGGAVFINGRGRIMKRFKRMSCYIQQDDRLQGLLTVGENMKLAADLKLPTNLDKYEKGEVIEDILTNLGLYEHMNTRGAQLSGGQRKRLSIALELINNPLIMFLDEPTTGLDSSSCTQVVQLCRSLAHQGRTIVCTVHQPSASLFALFDQVYVLAAGRCMYQGTTKNLVPYLEQGGIPCPIYHNPADYIIELSCGEYGQDKIDLMANKSENGRALDWLDDHQNIPTMEGLRKLLPLSVLRDTEPTGGDEETSQSNQLRVLIKRGFMKAKRDATMTHLRLIVNVVVGIMLGSLFINAGNEGSRVIENYNLLFAILMHHMMSPMMLTILTFPNEMSILSKEHFNRWYSLGSFYTSITIVDLPVSIVGCAVFSVIVYTMSSQPLDIVRFSMFFAISLYTVLVAQSFGLMIGAVFSVVNGTFLGPTLSVPMMMFAGFGVTLRDLPAYLRWGSYVSYLRYGLEGFIGAIYGLNRPILDCNEALYCHYKHPRTFLNEVAMSPDQFWWDVLALSVFVVVLRIAAFVLLKWKLDAVRAGGLVTAVAPVVIRGGGIWVGWPGIHLDDPNEKIPESDPNDKTPTAGLLSEKIVPIHAEPKLFDSYYNGCCNGTFWPLFHSMPDRATFIADHWRAYIKCNEEFAEKTVYALHLLKQQKGKNGTSPPIVWVHDYHLMLAANWIRQRVEEDDIKCKLAFFLHIPFPPWDIFRLFPWSDEVLQGILGCDMVGFHITDYCLNFIDCCQRNLGCRVDRKNLLVELGGRTICVRPLPIGVPFDRFVQLAQNAKTVLSTSQQIILGVDRLDYTKGLVHRLKAFERLLEKYPEHIKKVMLLQISVPSRTDVKEYQDLKEEMDQLVGRINGRFTTPNWSPIRYIYGCVGQDELAAFYRDAAVALVTPLRDGMNLVAKEFVACQINKPPGVLIVSPFAGAGEMMHEALICNPYELDDAAEVIHRALIMPEDERTVRMNHLRRREQLNDVDSWMKAFLKAMDSLEEEADDIGATSMQPVTIDDFDEYLSKYIGYTQKLALLLDYDGTLAPIAPHPDLATLPLETKHTLQRLSNMSDVYIAIISGRNVNNVKNMVGIEGITYAGNHGLEILHPDGSKFVHPMPMELQDKVVDLLKALQEQVCKDGAWVENKGALLTFHYRETPADKRPALVEQARKLITAAGFTPAPAHCALEARPPVEWDKGRASIYILRTAFGLDWSERIRIIYAGDDVTDEDAMLALKGMAATFRIASSQITKTSAERRLSSTDSVLAMLKWVERHFSRRKPRANSLTYKSARKARDTIQMHMSYQMPAKTSPRHTPPLTPDKTSSGSESS